MSCYISQPDGRVIVEARVRVSATGDSEPVRLAVDTGSHFTMIAPSTVARLSERNPKCIRPLGRVRLGNLGLVYTVTCLDGIALDVEVEDFGGGNLETRSEGRIFVHDIEPLEKLFPTGVEGLFGMGQLDKLGVDVVKNLARTRAYLAKRV